MTPIDANAIAAAMPDGGPVADRLSPRRSGVGAADTLPTLDGQAPPVRRPLSVVTVRRWRSSDLFGPDHEVEIEHGPSVYRLRLTSLGKLILTK